jgi:phosphoribulokinase
VRPILTRHQKDTIFAGIFCAVALLVVMQLWLLTATMNAFMGADDTVVWPGAVASLACLLVNVMLLRRLLYLQGAAH